MQETAIYQERRPDLDKKQEELDYLFNLGVSS